MEEETTVCNECNGTGSNKANWQNLDESGEVRYEPIECPSCGGSGEEPF